MQQAQERLIGDCMKKHGFSYTPVVGGEQPVEEIGIPFVGITTLDPVPHGEDPPPPAKHLSAPEQDALFGTGKTVDISDGRQSVSLPADGCQAEAAIEMTGGIEGFKAGRVMVWQLYEGIDKAGREAADTPEVKDATAKWAACMKAKGQPFATPAAVAAKVPTGKELKSWQPAVDDMACKTETGYLKIVEAAMDAGERKYADAHPGLVTQWKESEDRSYAKAKQVLGQK